MDVERALRESLAANDLTLWSASGACVVNVDTATRNLAASLAARLSDPAPVTEGLDVDLFRRGWEAGYKSGESDARRAYAAASPSPETE